MCFRSRKALSSRVFCLHFLQADVDTGTPYQSTAGNMRLGDLQRAQSETVLSRVPQEVQFAQHLKIFHS